MCLQVLQIDNLLKIIIDEYGNRWYDRFSYKNYVEN